MNHDPALRIIDVRIRTATANLAAHKTIEPYPDYLEELREHIASLENSAEVLRADQKQDKENDGTTGNPV